MEKGSISIFLFLQRSLVICTIYVCTCRQYEFYLNIYTCLVRSRYTAGETTFSHWKPQFAGFCRILLQTKEYLLQLSLLGTVSIFYIIHKLCIIFFLYFIVWNLFFFVSELTAVIFGRSRIILNLPYFKLPLLKLNFSSENRLL